MARIHVIRLLSLCVIVSPQLVFGSASVAAEQLSVRAGTSPQIAISEYPPGDDGAIESQISTLAAIGSPSNGYMPWITAPSFLPIQSTVQADALIPDRSVLIETSAMTALVAEGPRAWPHLLKHLDDATPTRMSLQFDPHGMFNVGDMPTNPISTFEVGRHPTLLECQSMTTHAVTIGDLCFVIMGQILGRDYSAVSGEGFCTVINSPTGNPGLLRAVRSAWQTTAPRQRLLNSLLTDFSTQAVFTGNIHDGKSLEGLFQASRFHCLAALRLLYYFPQQADAMISTAIDRLDLDACKTQDAVLQQYFDNGVKARQFMASVAWSAAPLTAAAVRRACARAQRIDEVLASLPPVADSAQLDRLAAIIGSLPVDGSYDDACQLMGALLARDPARAEKACTQYLTNDILRRYALCEALKVSSAPWAIALICPLLDDRRSNGGWTHAASAGANAERLPSRVCDFALEALLTMTSHAKVDLLGSEQDLDQQIAALRRRLAPK